MDTYIVNVQHNIVYKLKIISVGAPCWKWFIKSWKKKRNYTCFLKQCNKQKARVSADKIIFFASETKVWQLKKKWLENDWTVWGYADECVNWITVTDLSWTDKFLGDEWIFLKVKLPLCCHSFPMLCFSGSTMLLQNTAFILFYSIFSISF